MAAYRRRLRFCFYVTPCFLFVVAYMHCNKGRTAKVNCNIELRRRRHKHRLPLNVDQ